jgi:hypothetical protein
MERAPKPAVSSSATGQLVRTLVDVLVHTGADLQEAQTLIRLAQQSAAHKSRDPTRRPAVDHVVRALFVWHTDPKFTDANGHPKPLALRGKSASLESLLRLSNHGRCTDQELTLLSRNPSVHRHGQTRYAPITQLIDVKADREWMLHYACLTAARLLRTALNNSIHQATASPLIERLAYVPRLPVDLVPQFEQFANAQGAELIKAVDRWLEARQTKPTGRRLAKETVMAGVHVFGFIDNAES